MASRVLLYFVLCAAALPASAATVFEGFYRIERNRKHVGFGVQRLRAEGDQRILTSYYRFKRPDDTEVFESSKTVTGANGDPVSSEHHGTRLGLAPSWAKFAGGRGRVDFVTPNSRKPTAVSDVKILSSALFLVADLPKLLLNHVYRYSAFAEERAINSSGTLHVAGKLKVGPVDVLRLLDDFNGEPTEHFVSLGGQPLGSRAYAGDFSCYWVKSREDAIDIFAYPNKDVISLFGDLPMGQKNDWNEVAGLNADEVMRRYPKWRGTRVRSLAALAKTTALPVRPL
jgi:hypothetical protein